MFVRSAAEVERVRTLFLMGLGDSEISRRTGIPRSTIKSWRLARIVKPRRHCLELHWRPLDQVAYSYVLGLYLGDGYVAVGHTSSSLTFVLDDCYPRIIESARVALLSVFAGRTVNIAPKHGEAATVLRVNGPEPAAAFPHHGDGKKHERPIVLAPWQREITLRHPEALLRGLIHSDGSRRASNRFSTRLPSGRIAEYAYPRYFFTNYSEDIREIFREHRELIASAARSPVQEHVGVARDSVALLDAFVGPEG